jgi:hypothetical protein
MFGHQTLETAYLREGFHQLDFWDAPSKPFVPVP